MRRGLYCDSVTVRVAWWCSGYGVGLVINWSRVGLPAVRNAQNPLHTFPREAANLLRTC